MGTCGPGLKSGNAQRVRADCLAESQAGNQDNLLMLTTEIFFAHHFAGMFNGLGHGVPARCGEGVAPSNDR